MMKHRRLAIMALFIMLGGVATGQAIGGWHVNAVGEEQYSITSGRWNFSSMLDYGIDINLWRGAQLSFSGLTTYMQHDEDYLGCDPLVFSNIDTESKWFRVAVLGLTQKIGNVEMFVGLRNTGPDYFADDELAYFIGSMHGIQPAVSQNFDIATFPTAALTTQVKWDVDEHWQLKATLYNGKSSDEWGGLFEYGDGLIGLTAFNYHTSARTYEAGVCMGKDNFGKTSAAVYAYGIERLTDKISLVGEAGYYFGGKEGELHGEPEVGLFDLALGGIYTFDERNAVGAICTYDHCDEGIYDMQIELNYRHTYGPLAIQPTLVLDHLDGEATLFAVLRATLSFGE